MKIIIAEDICHKFSNSYPFVFTKGYADFCKRYEKSEVIYFVSENYQCFLPAKIYKTAFLKVLRFLFPPLCGGNLLLPEKEKQFLEDAVSLIKKNKICHRVLQPENFCLFRSYPENSIVAPFGSYRINLTLTYSELEKNLQPNYRNKIRKAQKSGAIILEGEEQLKHFYLIYKKMTDRKNIYCEPFEYFTTLYKAMEGNILCRVIYLNNVPLGGLIILWSKYGAFYLHGCSEEKTQISGLIKYLHWNTIMMMKEKGVMLYDFVGARLRDVSGTSLEGVQAFKERFGGQLVKGFLWKMDIDKTICKVYDLLLKIKMAAKRQLPLLDIIDQELSHIKLQCKHETSQKYPFHF
jgi:hypothetical protein